MNPTEWAIVAALWLAGWGLALGSGIWLESKFARLERRPMELRRFPASVNTPTLLVNLFLWPLHLYMRLYLLYLFHQQKDSL